jgi:hypothetical protein
LKARRSDVDASPQGVVDGDARREEVRRLIGVPERRNARLELGPQAKAEGREDDEVSRPVELVGVQHAGVEVEGEERGLGMPWPQGLEDE